MANKEDEQNIKFWSFKSYRLLLTVIFCLTDTANSLLRGTISFAMVCMVSVNKTDDQSPPDSYENSTCYRQNTDDCQGTFNWNSYEQGIVFSALQIGGMIAVMPAGWIADRYDPKTVVTISMFMISVGSLLSPITAYKGGFVGFAILRLIMGFFGQSVVYVGIAAICAQWIPPAERSTVISIYTAGNSLGGFIGSPLNAFLCYSYNWESIFYINAIFGITAFILCVIFVANRPANSRFISTAERRYIERSLANQGLGRRKEVTQKLSCLKMITSLAILSILLCNFAAALMGNTLSQYIPTYFKDVLYVSLLSNGLYNALPNIVSCVSKLLTAMIADLMKQKTKISPTWICKIFNSIRHFGAAAFLVACSYMTCSTVGWAVTFLCFANTAVATTASGYQTSAISVAPPFSGMVMSYCQLAGQLGAIVSPYIVSVLTPDSTVQEWQNVFFVMAAVMALTGLLFLAFGSAKIQKWAVLDKESSTNHIVVYPENPSQITFTHSSSNMRTKLDEITTTLSPLS